MATVPQSPGLPDVELSFQDGLGIRYLATDPTSGDRIERLCVTYELARQAAAIEERVARLENFRHPRFPRVRAVEISSLQNAANVVWVHADLVDGVRLSELLTLAEQGRILFDINTVLQVARELLPALATLHDSRNVTHGAVSPSRIVLTRQGRIALVDHYFGAALARLQYPRSRLWREFRIAMPPAAGLPRFDARADVAMVATTVLALLLGQSIALNEFPDRFRDLLDRARERQVSGRERPLGASLRAWLERTLPIESRRPLSTALEAQVALEDAIKKERAYAPGASALKHFIERAAPVLDALHPGRPNPVADTLPPPRPAALPASRVVRMPAPPSRPQARLTTPEEEEADEIAFLERELARLAAEEAAQRAAATGSASPAVAAPGGVTQTDSATAPGSSSVEVAGAPPVIPDEEWMPIEIDAAVSPAPGVQDPVGIEPTVEVIAEVPLRLADSPVVEFNQYVDSDLEARAEPDADAVIDEWALVPPGLVDVADSPETIEDTGSPGQADAFTLRLDFERMHESALLPARAAAAKGVGLPACAGLPDRVAAACRDLGSRPLARAMAPLPAIVTEHVRAKQRRQVSRRDEQAAQSRRGRRKPAALPSRTTEHEAPLMARPAAGRVEVAIEAAPPLRLVPAAARRRRKQAAPALAPNIDAPAAPLAARASVPSWQSQPQNPAAILRLVEGRPRVRRQHVAALAADSDAQVPAAMIASPAVMALVAPCGVEPSHDAAGAAVARETVDHTADSAMLADDVASPVPVAGASDTEGAEGVRSSDEWQPEPTDFALPIGEVANDQGIGLDACALAGTVGCDARTTPDTATQPVEELTLAPEPDSIADRSEEVPAPIVRETSQGRGEDLSREGEADATVSVMAETVALDAPVEVVSDAECHGGPTPEEAAVAPPASGLDGPIAEPRRPDDERVGSDAPSAVDPVAGFLMLLDGSAGPAGAATAVDSAGTSLDASRPDAIAPAGGASDPPEPRRVLDLVADDLAPPPPEESDMRVEPLHLTADGTEVPERLVRLVVVGGLASPGEAVGHGNLGQAAEVAALVEADAGGGSPTPGVVSGHFDQSGAAGCEDAADPLDQTCDEGWSAPSLAAGDALAGTLTDAEGEAGADAVPVADHSSEDIAFDAVEVVSNPISEHTTVLPAEAGSTVLDATVHVSEAPEAVAGDALAEADPTSAGRQACEVAAPEPRFVPGEGLIVEAPLPEGVGLVALRPVSLEADPPSDPCGPTDIPEVTAPQPQAYDAELEALLAELRAAEDAEDDGPAAVAPEAFIEVEIPIDAALGEGRGADDSAIAAPRPDAEAASPVTGWSSGVAGSSPPVAMTPEAGESTHSAQRLSTASTAVPAPSTPGRVPGLDVPPANDESSSTSGAVGAISETGSQPATSPGSQPQVVRTPGSPPVGPQSVPASHQPDTALVAPAPAAPRRKRRRSGKGPRGQRSGEPAALTGAPAGRPPESAAPAFVSRPPGEEPSPLEQRRPLTSSRESWSVVARRPDEAARTPDRAAGSPVAPPVVAAPTPPDHGGAVESTLPVYAPWLTPEPIPPRAAEAAAPDVAIPVPAAPAAAPVPLADSVAAPPPTTGANRPGTSTSAARSGELPSAGQFQTGHDLPAPTFGMAAEVGSHRSVWRWLPWAAGLLLAVVGAGGTYWRSQPPATAVLTLETSVEGIEMFVDGRPTGQLPLSVELPAGRHVIELRGLGTTRTFPVDLGAGAKVTQTVKWPAARPAGALKITSTPPGARVLVGGEMRGVTPVEITDIPAGTHALTIENDTGSVRRSVEVEAGETTAIDVPIFAGWLQVFAPFRVRVFEDGRLIATSEDGKVLVPPGVHKLELVNTALGVRESRTVEITPGGTTALSLEAPTSAIGVEAPDGTEVWIDGDLRGTMPGGPFPVKVGTREVVLRHPRLGQRRAILQVGATATARASFFTP